MARTPRILETSVYPPEAGRVQLTLHIDVFSDKEGARVPLAFQPRRGRNSSRSMEVEVVPWRHVETSSSEISTF